MQLCQPAAALMESTNAQCGCWLAAPILLRHPHHPGLSRSPKSALTHPNCYQQRMAIRCGILHTDGRGFISRINVSGSALGGFSGPAWRLELTPNEVHPIPAKSPKRPIFWLAAA
jgi:hypothetical protein